MSENTTGVLDDLLDATLDDLADLPQVAPYPVGSHVAQMFIFKSDKKVGQYIQKFVYKNTLELAVPTDVPPKEGDVAMIRIYTKKKEGERNEMGEGQLKQALVPVAERLGLSRLGEVIDAIAKEGIEVAITTGLQKQKDPQYPDQMVLKKIELT